MIAGNDGSPGLLRLHRLQVNRGVVATRENVVDLVEQILLDESRKGPEIAPGGQRVRFQVNESGRQLILRARQG